MTTIKCAGCGNDVEVRPGDEGMDHLCDTCVPEQMENFPYIGDLPCSTWTTESDLQTENERLRKRIAELEAENHQLRCDTKEVAAARSFLRDQNRLLEQLSNTRLAIVRAANELGKVVDLSVSIRTS